MSPENPKHTGLKQKAAHEFREIVIVFVYLAFFFCALATYSTLLLEKYEISVFQLWRRADQRFNHHQNYPHRRSPAFRQ